MFGTLFHCLIFIVAVLVRSLVWIDLVSLKIGNVPMEDVLMYTKNSIIGA